MRSQSSAPPPPHCTTLHYTTQHQYLIQHSHAPRPVDAAVWSSAVDVAEYSPTFRLNGYTLRLVDVFLSPVTRNRYKTRVTPSSAVFGCWYILDSVQRDTHEEWVAAYERDHTQENVPSAANYLVQDLGTRKSWIVVKKLFEGDAAWSKGMWPGKSESNTKHIVGTQNGVMAASTIRTFEPT